MGKVVKIAGGVEEGWKIPDLEGGETWDVVTLAVAALLVW